MLALNSEENEVTKDIEMAVTELPEFATTLGNETNYVNARYILTYSFFYS